MYFRMNPSINMCATYVRRCFLLAISVFRTAHLDENLVYKFLICMFISQMPIFFQFNKDHSMSLYLKDFSFDRPTNS